MSRFRQYTSLATGVLDRIVRPRVSRVTFLITYDCNQRCKTCDIWQVNKRNPGLREQEITLEEFTQFCQYNDLLWISLCGGEPFIRADIGEILRTALNSVKLVSITTNGSNTDTILSSVEYALRKSKGSTLAVNVSFNGGEEVHNGISGVEDSYRRALQTFSGLQKIKTSRLKAGISYTTSALNLGKFPDFVEGMGKDFPGLEGLTYGIGQEADLYQWQKGRRIVPGKDSVKTFIDSICRDFKKGVSPLNWINYKYLDLLRNGKALPKCVAGDYTLLIDPYWKVYPCMFLCPNTPVGDLREAEFNISKLDHSRCKEAVRKCGKCPSWTPCEAYNIIVFRPWRVF